VTLKRYPDGVEGKFFYEKRSPKHRPDWVATTRIWSESHKAEIDYTLIEDLPTLIWSANLANIELHTSLARVGDLDRPCSLVFDLDPATRRCRRLRPRRPPPGATSSPSSGSTATRRLRLEGPPPARAAERQRHLRSKPAPSPRRWPR